MTSPPEPSLDRIDEARLRAVFDNIPARIALLDRERRYRYVNREYIEFAGVPARDIIGRTVPEVLSADSFADFWPASDRALAGETVEWSGWIDYQLGRRFIQRVCVPFRDATGAIDGFFIFNRDLTDLKNSEQALADQLAALKSSEALNAAIIAAALDCIIAIDETGRVVEFNPAAEQTFGYRRDEAIGRMIGELVVPPSLRQRHADGFARYLRTGERSVIGRRIEIEAMRASGETFPVELTITEIRLPERRLFTAHLRDLTAARAAQAEILRQREALHQSEKMAAFGSLLAGVAHELNNPLSIVIGNAMMLAEEAEQTAPSLAGRAERVRAAAERCGRIVRTFLAMARQREARRQPIAVLSLLDSVFQLLAYGMRSGGIAIEQQVPPDLPMLSCDPDQMRQVLSNLLINASQALEARRHPRLIRISARVDGEWLEIEISDNGPGVPDEIRSRVFDPFFTTKPEGTGTGIGLGVCRGIVEAHGGTLRLAESDGSGARFILRLPLRNDPSNSPDGHPAGSSPDQEPHARSVLIVDDEAYVGALLAELLNGLGYRCTVVESGAAAMTLLLRRDYDAIICDLRMPEVDGPGLFAWIEVTRPHLVARMAFITGDTLGATAADFLARAHRPVLEKPFMPEELRRLMRELVPDPAA
jgi:two-component system NtrC family sensor kinase